MNWLAHLLLSEPTPEFRLGSILPDLVPSAVLAALPAEFQQGIRRHQRIDAYTDAHALFRLSVQRINPPYRRFGGILIDVFYDHFLARDWHSFSDVPLPRFADEVYASFTARYSDIPPDARQPLQRMQAENWLYSYHEIEGIAAALSRISSRFRRPFDLAPSLLLLERDYELFHSDFSAFFPQLSTYVRSGSPLPRNGVSSSGRS
ncbi:MAG: ACP phosphodiesterase [Verrucomicrobiota bacterium]